MKRRQLPDWGNCHQGTSCPPVMPRWTTYLHELILQGLKPAEVLEEFCTSLIRLQQRCLFGLEHIHGMMHFLVVASMTSESAATLLHGDENIGAVEEG